MKLIQTQRSLISYELQDSNGVPKYHLFLSPASHNHFIIENLISDDCVVYSLPLPPNTVHAPEEHNEPAGCGYTLQVGNALFTMIETSGENGAFIEISIDLYAAPF